MRFKVNDVISGYTVEAIDETARVVTLRDAEGRAATRTFEQVEAMAAPAADASAQLPLFDGRITAVVAGGVRHSIAANRSMVEGSETSLNDRMDAVRAAVSRAYNQGPGEYCYTEVVFDDYVILRKSAAPSQQPKLWKVPYTFADDGTVTLGGAPVEVRVAYTPVKEGVLQGLGQVFGPVEEADGAAPTGKRWNVLIIQEGLSKNRNRYSRKTLQEAVKLYEGAKIYLDHDEGGRRFGRSMKDLAGFIKSPHPVLLSTSESATAPPLFGIAGTAVVTKPEVREALLDAWNEGQVDLFGLSHDVEAASSPVMDASGGYYDVTKIATVKSVDFVTNPAAGGRVLRLVASDVVSPSLHEDLTMLKQLIEAIKASGRADLIAKLEALGATPGADAVIALHQQLLEAAAPAAAPRTTEAVRPQPAATQVGAAVTIEEAELLELRRDGAAHFLESSLAGCALPEQVKVHLRKRFTKTLQEATRATLPTKEAITAAIAEQVELFGQLAEAQVVLPAAGVSRIEITKGRRDKVVEAFDAFFGVKQEGKGADGQPILKLLPAGRATSFRQLYVDVTGDQQVSGRVSEATRLTEALDSTTFDQILGDSITRRMLAEYAMASQAQWRGTIAEVVSVNDFRQQKRQRFGGYPNLSIVTQGGPYPSLTSPTDEEATYSPAKRGGTEQITREMILNDDVGVIRRIPVRLARAASQTLYEFVFDFLRLNSTIYDTVALAAAGHNNNISTTALSATQLTTLRNRIKTMSDMSNGKRLGLSAKFLWVPTELEELAFQITMANRAVPDASLAAQAEPAAPNFIQKIGIEARVVDYWTDTNNYWLTADVSQTPMIEIGFVGGREEPELFLQDQPNVGSMFSHDQLTYKIRHEYGGGVVDYRGFAGGIVA